MSKNLWNGCPYLLVAILKDLFYALVSLVQCNRMSAIRRLQGTQMYKGRKRSYSKKNASIICGSNTWTMWTHWTRRILQISLVDFGMEKKKYLWISFTWEMKAFRAVWEGKTLCYDHISFPPPLLTIWPHFFTARHCPLPIFRHTQTWVPPFKSF